MTSTTTTIAVLPPCGAADCDKPCVFLSPPPPPAAAAAAAADVNRNHLGPFLIAAVCILGISFLFLTSCTIILRCHFKRRRRPDSPTNESSSSSSSSSSVDHPIWNIVTVGLPQSVIDSITTFKYTNHDCTHCTCSVCLADFQVGDCLRLLPNCTHAFHLPCIDTWLRSHQNCPLCRAPILLNHFPTSTSTSTSTNTHTPQLHLHLPPQDDDDDANTINHLERLRVPRFSRVNRNSRVLSDLGVYYRFTTLHQHQHRDILIPHPITRSFSLNLLPASTIQAAASSTTHAYANANVDGVVDERPKTVENAPKRGTSTSGLGFLMIKSSSIGHSFQKGPVPIKRSLSLGAKLFSFPRTKSHNSILPL